jgi:hypothetical protein
MFICLFPGSRVTTDQRVVAKQEIQEVESTPFTSPGPNDLGYVHGVGAAAGNSDHVEEERNIWIS